MKTNLIKGIWAEEQGNNQAIVFESKGKEKGNIVFNGTGFEIDGETLTNQSFTGAVNLSRHTTHYLPYTVTSNIVLTKVANPIINGGAFVRMIANGTNTPVFSAFKKIAGSSDWDTTLNTIHVVGFGYDGVDAWYNIITEAV